MSEQTPPEPCEKAKMAARVMERLDKEAGPVLLNMTSVEAAFLYAELQLALRHPLNHGAGSSVAKAVCQSIRNAFVGDLEALWLLDCSDKGRLKSIAAIQAAGMEESRPRMQIVRTHDMLTMILAGVTPLRLKQETLDEMDRTLGVLCWVLMHEPGNKFGTKMLETELALRKLGFMLVDGGADAHQ